MPVPTRYPSGVSLSAPGFALGNFPLPSGPYGLYYFNDFTTYAAGDWTVTAVGGGTSALTGVLGGALLQTTGATEDDIQANQLTTKNFAFASGVDLWFSINVTLGEATQSDVIFGLADTFADATPTDGIYFLKVDGSTTLNLLITNTGTSTTIPVGTVAAATAYTFSYFYNGSAASPALYVYSTIPYAAGTVTKPNPYWPGGNLSVAMARSGGTYTLANIPATTTLLTPGFGVHAGSAGAKTMTTNYILAAQTIPTRY